MLNLTRSGGCIASVAGTADVSRIRITTSTMDSFCSRCRPNGIYNYILRIRSNIVKAPFANVTEHIVKAPCIRHIRADPRSTAC